MMNLRERICFRLLRMVLSRNKYVEFEPEFYFSCQLLRLICTEKSDNKVIKTKDNV